MAVKNEKKENIRLLYGNDLVSLSLRKEELIKTYFKGEVPDTTVLESPGNYEACKNALGGQSLFFSKTAVIIQNPFFLKKTVRNEKEEKEFDDFIMLLRELPHDTLVILIVEGTLDKRLKTTKELSAICFAEECTLLNPREGASRMSLLLAKEGKQMDSQARAYLEEVLGSWEELSLPLLQTECDKIVLMAGTNPKISKRLLEVALPDYMDQGIFRFTDALMSKRADLVLRRADRVFRNPGETIKNVGFLASRFRKIKILKELQRNHASLQDMQKKLEIRNQWAWKSLLKDAGKVTEEEAEEFLLGLFNYQMALRRGENDILKDLLLRFCLRK
ncbi:MAG: DNA polymerase III subunit delta [Dialister sp.]|nr:DNA polymerase III subunit delta [Dialister sp.]